MVRTARPTPASSTSWPEISLAPSFPRCATALALCLALIAVPLAAQDTETLPTLEDLIPDAAVADPEGWAAQGEQANGAAPEDVPPTLDADSPMEPMPLVTLEDPAELELAEVEPIAPEEEVEFATFDEVIPPLPEGSEERISDELILVFPSDDALFPVREEFLARFKSLSTIQGLSDEDNLSRLAAQARADEELLLRMLRVYGYFDGQVIRSVGDVREQGTEAAALDVPAARFDIIPGRRYRFGSIDLGDIAAAGPDYPALRQSFEVDSGDLLSLDDIEHERADLDVMLGETGYPFAAIGDPALLVDHDREEGDLTMSVSPNGKYVMGRITSNLPRFMSGEHLEDIARFDPGEVYQRSDEMDLRRAILATGIVGSVTLTPVSREEPAPGQPGVVDIAVEMTRAPLRTIAGNIGYGTEEGIRLEASWEHRNLFPPEGSLRLRGIAGTQEQLAGVTFRKNNFKGRDRILTLDAFASTVDYDAYEARTASLIGTYERVSTLLFQKPFSYSGGLELVATQEREAIARDVFGLRQTYFVAALPTYAQIDTSDDLLDPTEGMRVSARLSPEVSRTNGEESFYLRAQVDGSYYQSLSEKLVLAGRARVASIPGAPTDAIAPSRRLYAGGGGSVRGYGYREIGPRNTAGDPRGGRSLIELSAEARIRTGMFGGALGVVPFVDAGTVGNDSVPDFGRIQFGAGIGLRYYTGFGPLRLDIAAPLNPGPGDAPVAVYVALGQAF